MSAVTFQAIGYYGIYAVNSTCGVLSISWMLFVCKENPDGKPFEPKTPEVENEGFLTKYIWNGLVKPGIDLFQGSNSTAFPRFSCILREIYQFQWRRSLNYADPSNLLRLSMMTQGGKSVELIPRP